MAEVFNESFALYYEAFSGGRPRTFEYVAGEMTKIGPQVRKGERVVEVGSGTGNSAIVLLRHLPDIGQLIGIDPSTGMLQLARYKFGQVNLTFQPVAGMPSETFTEALTYIEKQKEKARPFRDKVTFFEASAHSMPITTATADRVYCPESFHWLALPQPNRVDFSFLAKGVAEINRVLIPEGKLLLDSNGHLFRFGEEKIDGQKIDDVHFTKHPFRTRFNEAFAEIAVQSGYNIPIEGQEPSPIHYMFDAQKISVVLEQDGFRLLPAPDGKNYHFRPLHFTLKDIIRATTTSALMGHFRKPELENLPIEEKSRWISEAIKDALKKTPEDSGSYYETFVLFVAQKL